MSNSKKGEVNKMLKKGFLCFALSFFSLILFSNYAFSQTDAGGALRQELDLLRERRLERKITAPRPKPEEAAEEYIIPEDAGPTILVSVINVEGATLLTPQEIRAITSKFEGKELSLTAMQKIADLITDAYRNKGYATSRAYLPPQTVREGVLLIRVVEGKLGGLDIRGNRHFKTSLLQRKIGLQPGGYFDYSALQRSLVYINEHPDRHARAVLVPGAEPGTTDIIIDVEDRFPLHAGFEFDNYGSRYIGKYRYSLVLEHNNLLGQDDRAYYKFQYSDRARLLLHQARYNYPVNPALDIGFYYLHSRLKLGKELELVDARGRAYIFGLFLNQGLIMQDNLDLRLNLGFDYKTVKNYLLGIQESQDNVRLLKLGADLDFNDPWGRNIFLAQLDTGIPKILGGMPGKYDFSSRPPAGGRFYKGVFNLFRLQEAPLSTYLLWKNSAQYTAYNLVASEQFQIGGPGSVRGYPPAEHSGDKGYYTALELSLPFYFLSQEARVPFSEEKWYDALRLVLFYDWATVRLNRIEPGEKHRTLKGWGTGVRLNVRDDLACRVEVGFPLGVKPSDGKNAHPWVEFVWKF